MAKLATVGRMVEFFPGTNKSFELPNNMESAPAVVTQVFDPHINLTVFVADPNGNPVISAWSVSHKAKAQEGAAYWDFIS